MWQWEPAYRWAAGCALLQAKKAMERNKAKPKARPRLVLSSIMEPLRNTGYGYLLQLPFPSTYVTKGHKAASCCLVRARNQGHRVAVAGLLYP